MLKTFYEFFQRKVYIASMLRIVNWGFSIIGFFFKEKNHTKKILLRREGLKTQMMKKIVNAFLHPNQYKYI